MQWRHVDARLGSGTVALALVLLLMAFVSRNRVLAIAVTLAWAAGIVLGTRAGRMFRAFRGDALVRQRTPDRWSHGYIAGTVGYWSALLIAGATLDWDQRAAAFAAGSVLFYAGGKFGCWRCGCCGLPNRSLPLAEALACGSAGAASALLLASGYAWLATILAASVYGIARFTSLYLRCGLCRVTSAIDLAIPAALIALA